MSTTPQKNPDDKEIDLSQISKKMGQKVQSLNQFIFGGIQYFLKNIIAIIILFIIGFGIGIYLDRNQKTYAQQLIVIPNFGSADFLYNKIDLINSKIADSDTLYLKSIGFKYPKTISKIEIEPIIDPYLFVKSDDRNFDLLKLIAEDADMNRVLKDKVTSKNYAYHVISFSTKRKVKYDEMIAPLMNALNDNSYFEVVRKNIVDNVKLKIQLNDSTLVQINNILNSFANSVNGASTKNDKLVYYNENTQLNDVLKTKDELIREQGNRRIELVNYKKTINDISVVLNIAKPSSLKLFLGVFLVLLFLLAKTFLKFYKKQATTYKARLS